MLNYQFLSTLALSDEDFDSLVADHCTMLDTFVEKFAKDFSACSDVQDSDNETYLKALAKNPAFLKDLKVNNIRNDMKKNYECNFGLGRLEVEGEQRFLSCDLLALLIKILEHVKNAKLDDLKSLKAEQLRTDRFFMADGKLSIKPDKYYVFLRNPHLSRNEQVFLRAYVKRDSLHKKYFSHLKGVVMVSRTSTAPMALGGADFDGDLVKIISDKRIVKAVKEGHTQKPLPVIRIPSAKTKPRELTSDVSRKVIINTFANKVGLISNWAVKLSEKAYSLEPVEETYKNACATCPIVVGLEIDAAKSGFHPEKNIEELKVLMKSCGENIFLKSKEVIEQIRQGHYSLSVDDKEGNLVLYFLTKKNKTQKLKVSLEEVRTPLLKRLTIRYLQFIKETSKSDKKRNNGSSKQPQYFDFDILDSDWDKTLDEYLREKLGELIEAYQHILSLNNKLQYMKNLMEGKAYTGHVINILKLQYDD